MNRQILRLAIPNIISNLSVPLLSAVDTALMGHLENEAYIGAIAVGSIIFSFIYWGFGFLRMGTTGLTAQALGQQDEPEIISLLARGLLVALAGSICMIALQVFIARISFGLIGASAEVEQYAKEYFYIRIYAAPATIGLYAFHGWFLGMQNVRYPMYLTVLVNILNIVLNLFFVYEMGMKADGVALGTVLAQYGGLAGAILLFRHKYRPLLLQLSRQLVFQITKLRQFFQVNFDILIRTLCLVFTFSFFTAKSAAEGDVLLAANAVLLQFYTFLSYGVDGFAFAAESLTGKLKGASDASGLQRAVRLSFVWGGGLAILFTIIYALAGKNIILLFTDNEAIIPVAAAYLIWVVIAPIVNSTAFIWDGIYIGMTASKQMRNTMLISTFLIFLPACYLFRHLYGNHGLWLAMTLFMLSRGLLMTVLFRKVK